MIRKNFDLSKVLCPETESNRRHEDFQSSALPTELSGHKESWMNKCFVNDVSRYALKSGFYST